MQIPIKMIAVILTVSAEAAFASCTANDDNPSGQAVESRYVPLAPDYSDPMMWITEDGDADGTGADICINPVNWRTDATPATLHDTITITVAPEYHVLVATNYSASEYPPFRGFLNVGDIHSCEPWLYSECLAKNISVRARAWREKQTSVGIRLGSR